MSRRDSLVAITIAIFFSVMFFWLPVAESATYEAEPGLATRGLTEDIKTLGKMLGADFSQKPLPRVILLPPDKFSEAVKEEIAAGELPPEKYAAYFHCQKNIIVMRHPYTERTTTKHLGSKEHFLKIRFHELYHWAMCQTEGVHHFQVNKDPKGEVLPVLLQREESMAEMLERRYLIEILGVVAPVGPDFLAPFPPHQQVLIEKLLPEDPLLNAPLLLWWPTSEIPMAAETNGGAPIFTYTFMSAARQNKDEFLFSLVSHRGKCVEVKIFKNRIYYRGWSDRGYVGEPLSDKFPANPVYSGEWVRTK